MLLKAQLLKTQEKNNELYQISSDELENLKVTSNVIFNVLVHLLKNVVSLSYAE